VQSESKGISVVIPVFNGANYIVEAIDSVLAQSPAPLEIIVVDDGSTDDTPSVVGTFGPPVTYHRQENRGTSAARNLGAALATGELLAFLDADDLWAPRKLALQLAAMADDPRLEIVFGHVQEFFHTPMQAGDAGPAIPGLHPGAMLIRRPTFDRVGGFSEDFQQAEVVEWMARLMEREVMYRVIPDTVMYRRIHGSNKGRDNPVARSQYLHILKRHLDRRRATR